MPTQKASQTLTSGGAVVTRRVMAVARLPDSREELFRSKSLDGTETPYPIDLGRRDNREHLIGA